MSADDAARYNQFWNDVAAGKTVGQRMGLDELSLTVVGKTPYVFNPYDDDPAKTFYGSGKDTHPTEWSQLIEDLKKQGIEINYKYDNAHKGYAPKGSINPPQITIPPDASYSALIHEQQHYFDDLASEFPGWEKTLYNDAYRVNSEFNAYMTEIHSAEQAGNTALANQLYENFIFERNKILNK